MESANSHLKLGDNGHGCAARIRPSKEWSLSPAMDDSVGGCSTLKRPNRLTPRFLDDEFNMDDKSSNSSFVHFESLGSDVSVDNLGINRGSIQDQFMWHTGKQGRADGIDQAFVPETQAAYGEAAANPTQDKDQSSTSRSGSSTKLCFAQRAEIPCSRQNTLDSLLGDQIFLEDDRGIDVDTFPKVEKQEEEKKEGEIQHGAKPLPAKRRKMSPSNSTPERKRHPWQCLSSPTTSADDSDGSNYVPSKEPHEWPQCSSPRSRMP